MKKIEIIGAGMAGLLAGRMLGERKSCLIEAQSELPNNHSAVLRFRTEAVSSATGIPFRKVTMIKGALAWSNPIADALAYARKSAGEYRSDRSIVAGKVSAERYIAPPDFIAQMAEGQTITYGIAADRYNLQGKSISTVPMPALMELLGYPRRSEINFPHRSGFNVRAKILNCNAYATLYIPNPDEPITRVSITGDELICELVDSKQRQGNPPPWDEEAVACKAARYLGLQEADIEFASLERYHQRYSKILPIDEDARRRFIHWATATSGVFSLGRYATWRPGLLLDDVVQDVKLIGTWASRNTLYDVARSA